MANVDLLAAQRQDTATMHYPISQQKPASTTSQAPSSRPEDLYLDLEERVNPAQLQDLELRLPFQHTDTRHDADLLPPRGRLVWLRYIGLNIYRRLFSLAFGANLIAFVYILSRSHDEALSGAMNAAAANLLALGLARQPLVVNLLFVTFASLPRSTPLRLRRLAAKIYCYGGVHSGCGVAAFVWWNALVGILSYQYAYRVGDTSSPTTVTPAILGLAWVIEFLLLAIIVAAYPTLRFKLHDHFELTHRFCSWAVILLFWPLLGLFAASAETSRQQSAGRVLAGLPLFWMLIITTLAIIHPWALLRKVPIKSEPVSSHAIRLHFDHTTVDFGQGLSIARFPLRDWHSFATFSNIPAPREGPRGTTKQQPTFSCLISKAGDWTAHTIRNPPTHIWKRSVPIYGFGYVVKLFSRIVLVTTGSGIGPCLSLIGDPNRPAMRVIWQTRTPYKTYGEKVIELVRAMDSDPVIIDTSVGGNRVDMLPLVFRLYREFEAEAVAVISYPLMTKKLVWECESRGIPAFGPVFDS